MLDVANSVSSQCGNGVSPPSPNVPLSLWASHSLLFESVVCTDVCTGVCTDVTFLCV